MPVDLKLGDVGCDGLDDRRRAAQGAGGAYRPMILFRKVVGRILKYYCG